MMRHLELLWNLWISEFSVFYMVEIIFVVWYDFYISAILLVMSHIYANKLLLGIFANVSYNYVFHIFDTVLSIAWLKSV